MAPQELTDLRQRARQTFEHDLPQLLGERPEQYVAYHGAQQLGFSKQKHLLYQQCLEQGWQQEEFVVFCIVPQEDELIFGPMLFD